MRWTWETVYNALAAQSGLTKSPPNNKHQYVCVTAKQHLGASSMLLFKPGSEYRRNRPFVYDDQRDTFDRILLEKLRPTISPAIVNETNQGKNWSHCEVQDWTLFAQVLGLDGTEPTVNAAPEIGSKAPTSPQRKNLRYAPSDTNLEGTSIAQQLETVKLWAEIASASSWKDARQLFPGVISTFDVRLPQPGYIGNEYRRGGIVFMGSNPGRGGKVDYQDGDREMFRLIRALSGDPSPERMTTLMDNLREYMPSWDILKRIQFPKSFHIRWPQIAYFNVLHVNTDIEIGRVPGPVWKYAIDRFTCRQLDLLSPSIVVVFGKGAAKRLEEYWTPAANAPKICSIIHPTSKAANASRTAFLEQLASARKDVKEVMALHRN